VSDATDTRRPGRPRSPEAHAAILRAAMELALEGGVRGLSMEAIAARAGVGKATIYRRWKSKEALFAEAVQQMARTPAAPDTGTVRSDIETSTKAVLEGMTREALRIMPRLLADAADDPALLAAMQDALLTPRRAMIGEILRRGVARGELRADLDVELVTHLLFGSAIAHVLMSGGDTTALVDLPLRVFDTLAAGIVR
jgi:AcrR family transcriptional regulator